MTTPLHNRVDLHTHTSRSDGVLEPAVLYEQMRAWGSAMVAITDHDTLAGANELLDAGPGDGEGKGPHIITGIEINTRFDDQVIVDGTAPERVNELHILGFGFDRNDAAFAATLATQREGRQLRLDRTLQQLAILGIDVRDLLPEVPGGIDALGRPHVARALVAGGHAESVDDAFRRYLEPGAPGYVRRAGIGPRAAIDAVVSAGGIASLAHARWAPDHGAIIDRLIDWGLGALEVYYHHFDDETVRSMAAFAADRGLLATGGSDYHGDTMDYATAQATTFVPIEAGERLLAAITEKSTP